MSTESPTPPPPRRRHVWRWVLLGVVLCLSPFVFLGIAAASFLTLNRNAAVLRNHVMGASDAKWHTKIQLDIGGVTLDAVRLGMVFAHGSNVDDARLALAAVRHASVGVYECRHQSGDTTRGDFFTETDRAMANRGFVRMAGIHQNNQTVMVYIPRDMDAGAMTEVCVAVVSNREMVVVSTRVDADKLAELAMRHMEKDGFGHGKMNFAKMRF